jgi:hypothetical protein
LAELNTKDGGGGYNLMLEMAIMVVVVLGIMVEMIVVAGTVVVIMVHGTWKVSFDCGGGNGNAWYSRRW